MMVAERWRGSFIYKCGPSSVSHALVFGPTSTNTRGAPPGLTGLCGGGEVREGHEAGKGKGGEELGGGEGVLYVLNTLYTGMTFSNFLRCYLKRLLFFFKIKINKCKANQQK